LYNKQKEQLENEVFQLKREAVKKEQQKMAVVSRQRKEIDDLKKQLKRLTPLSQTDNTVKKVYSTQTTYLPNYYATHTYNNTVLMNMIW